MTAPMPKPGSPLAEIAGHYSRGNLLDRLRALLAEDGADPDRPMDQALAPYDHFHGRGLEATEEAAAVLPIKAADSVLDIGSGIGGPARYFARRFGCKVTGIDLTPEFCAVARALNAALGIGERVTFQQGDATALPFADASFDAAYSMNVSMNIADKDRLYREIHRVLKPGGRLVLSELARGPGPAPDYPTPWATTPAQSFLSTPDATRQGLEAAGFTILETRDKLKETLAYGERVRAMAERGEKPPRGAVQLIHGDLAKQMMANVARGIAAGSLVPIEILAQKA